MITIPISQGELIDKITILEIKSDRIKDAEKLKSVTHELSLLCQVRDQHLPQNAEIDRLTLELRKVNEELWDIEDELRVMESQKDFSLSFVTRARAVYITNDRRAAIKKEINLLLGATIQEEKSYQSY